MGFLIGVIAAQISGHLGPTQISRTLSTFSSGNSHPLLTSGYSQGMAGTFPQANVFVSVGGYNPGVTYNNVYTISSGSSSFSSVTSYPTTIFQTAVMAFNGKFFVFGGNGQNGYAGGGSTNSIYYMTTSLNSWTAGTSLISSGGHGVGYTPNYLVVSDNSAWYRGTGTSTWTVTTTPPNSSPPVTLNSGYAYVNAGSSTYFTKDDGTTYTNAGITPPLSTGGSWYGNVYGQTGYPIYAPYNTYYPSTPLMYYFSGYGYTSTNVYPQFNQGGNYSNNAPLGDGILNNQFISMRAAAGQAYATIN